MSALSLMAAHEHKWVKISEDDVVVISAHAIPGNETSVTRVINSLLPRRRGGGARWQRAGARLRARVARRAEVHAEPAAARSGSSRCTASTGTWSTTPTSPSEVGVDPRQDLRLRGRRRRHARATTASRSNGGRCRRATSTSTASSATSARACCATGAARRGRRGRGDRHGRPAHRRDRHGPRDRHQGLGLRRPRPRSCSRRRRHAVRGALAAAAAEGATDFETIRRHARRALGRFINERTKRRPAVIPVVMEV